MAGFVMVMGTGPRMKLMRSECSIATTDEPLSFDSHPVAHNDQVRHTGNLPLTGLRAEIARDLSA